MKKLLSLMLCLILTLAMTNISFAEQASQYLLQIPVDAKVVVVSEDNFDDFFEDVEVINEYETDLSHTYIPTKSANILCLAEVPQHLGIFSYDWREGIFTGFGIYNYASEFWMIQVANAPELDGWQIGALYDSINNTLYCFDSLILRFETVDNVRMLKYEQLSGGVVNSFKITAMTAKIKKLPFVTVTYNGEMIMFDQKPVIEEGRTLVPLRAIFEKLGAEIDWNGETSTVTATKDGTTISLTINNTTATKNGEAISLDVPAKIINGRTLVPVRFISDCFGVNVEWDGNARRVILTK